ncbi:MAG: DUF1735 domain-containing protein [Carboxylicivirga sp.]|jgi:hypothetical protein|nr:DUF1735 domain-containing protein [Carboxylicivirga sp.]
MMKKLFIGAYLLIGIILTTGLTSCEEEYFSETPVVATKAIVNDQLHPRNIRNYSITKDLLVNEVGIEGGPIQFGVKTNMPVESQCLFSAHFDTSFVSLFNEKNSTSYETIKKKHIEFKKENCTIGANKTISTDSIEIGLINETDIEIEDKALLPFNIIVDEGNVETSTNLGQFYALLSPKVFSLNNEKEASIMNNKVDNTIDFTPGKSFELDIESSVAAKKDVSIEVVVDKELLMKHNAEHDSNYELFPEDGYSLSASNTKILSGTRKPDTPISIEFKNEDDFNWGTTTIIPLQLKVLVDGKMVNDTANTTIIKVKTKEVSMVLADNEGQIGGTLIDTENAEINGSNYNFYGQAASSLFDQDISKGWISSNGAVFTIDLKAVKTLKGFAFKHDYLNYASYGSIKDIEISVSTDNTNWTSLSEVTVPAITKDKDNPITHYVRCVASEAQYIKIAFPRTYGSYVGLSFIGMYE